MTAWRLLLRTRGVCGSLAPNFSSQPEGDRARKKDGANFAKSRNHTFIVIDANYDTKAPTAYPLPNCTVASQAACTTPDLRLLAWITWQATLERTEPRLANRLIKQLCG